MFKDRGRLIESVQTAAATEALNINRHVATSTIKHQSTIKLSLILGKHGVMDPAVWSADG